MPHVQVYVTGSMTQTRHTVNMPWFLNSKILNKWQHKLKVFSLSIPGKFLCLNLMSILVFFGVKNREIFLSLVMWQKQKVWKGVVSTKNSCIHSKFIHMIITKGSIVKKFKLYYYHACHTSFHDLTHHNIQIRFKQAFRSRSLRFFMILPMIVTCTNLNIFHMMHFWHNACTWHCRWCIHPHPFFCTLRPSRLPQMQTPI